MGYAVQLLCASKLLPWPPLEKLGKKQSRPQELPVTSGEESLLENSGSLLVSAQGRCLKGRGAVSTQTVQGPRISTGC